MPDFAKILRTVRKNQNLTQEAAAEAFIIPLATLQRIEAGKRDLTYRELERIAEYCQRDVHEIVQLDDQEKESLRALSISEKEIPLGNIIVAQNVHITSLLEEIRNLYRIISNRMSEKEQNLRE